MEVCCSTGRSMSIGTGGEYLFIVTPMDLILGKISTGVIAINNGSL